MRGVIAGVVLGCSLALPPLASAQDARTMTVFVTAGPVAEAREGTKAEKDAHNAALKDLRATWKSLEKSLKAKHGSKRDKWPQEADLQLLEAEEAVFLELSDWKYRNSKQEGLDDSATDVKNSLIGKGAAGRKKHVTVVDSRDEAQLVVEIDGRRSERYWSLNPGDDDFYVRARISRGPKLSEAQFAAIPRAYRFRGAGESIMRLGVPGPDSPYWRFDSHGQVFWGAAGHFIAALVDGFIEENYGAMTAAR